MIQMLHVNSFTLKSAVIAGLYDTLPHYIFTLHHKTKTSYLKITHLYSMGQFNHS
ncbi:hypothetical protein WH47_07147 [Habropoda laboriosa]|uniref:Uncharacterized protein n=1 Tax=Habropoda laboriosa TaxID=597456 RepID=A0A0L7QQR2_9HYME|nr:hypothetical protein WH47_07147 [Habropoda laboriosa]